MTSPSRTDEWAGFTDAERDDFKSVCAGTGDIMVLARMLFVLGMADSVQGAWKLARWRNTLFEQSRLLHCLETQLALVEQLQVKPDLSEETDVLRSAIRARRASLGAPPEEHLVPEAGQR